MKDYSIQGYYQPTWEKKLFAVYIIGYEAQTFGNSFSNSKTTFDGKEDISICICICKYLLN